MSFPIFFRPLDKRAVTPVENVVHGFGATSELTLGCGFKGIGSFGIVSFPWRKKRKPNDVEYS